MPGIKKKWALEFHLAPKYEDGPDFGGTFTMNPQKVYLSEQEYKEMVEKIKTCKRNYRSFVEHKNHKIIYYVEKKTICIANIWSNSQNPEDFNEQLR